MPREGRTRYQAGVGVTQFQRFVLACIASHACRMQGIGLGRALGIQLHIIKAIERVWRAATTHKCKSHNGEFLGSR